MATIDPFETRHFVQFYESDDFLLDSVSGFIGAGLKEGEGAVVIARKEYRERLELRLMRLGVDLPRASATDQYVAVDAADTLRKLTSDGWPNEELFASVIRRLLDRAGRDGRHVRAFGEMVTLLWEAGSLPAAVRLEQYWDDLTRNGSVSLFCAYPVANVHGKVLDAALTEICRQHSSVIPSESYSGLESDEDRARAVVLLQQKARAFEAEIARRKELEASLFQREQELSDLFDNGVESLHKMAPDGTILWANQAELTLLGYPRSEYVGRNVAEFHADQRSATDILEQLLTRGTIHNYPARLRCKDGSVRDVLIHANGVWENGRLRHSRCFTRDVTERVRHEVERLLRSHPTSNGSHTNGSQTKTTASA
jgi:PAS domain S-box-containing protein